MHPTTLEVDEVGHLPWRGGGRIRGLHIGASERSSGRSQRLQTDKR